MTHEDQNYFQRRIAVESAMALATTGPAQRIHSEFVALYKNQLLGIGGLFVDERIRREG